MIFPDKESENLFNDTNVVYNETSSLIQELFKEISKASKQLDETWIDIKKIKGKITRKEYLQTLTKFSDYTLTNTPLIDESLSNIYAKINFMQLNIQRIQNNGSNPPELQTLEGNISNLKSIVDIEVKKNELNRTRFMGISNYLDTIQQSLSDARMETIAGDQHNISKYQIRVAIAVGIIAVITLGSSVWFGITTDEVLEQINTRQNEIANTIPSVKSNTQNVVLPVILDKEDNIYPSKILITPLGEHPVKINVTNATLKNNSHVSCFFDEKPSIILSGTWTTTMRSDEINSPVHVLLDIDYQPKQEIQELNLKEPLSQVKIAWIEYTVSIKDIQNNQTAIIQPDAWITTFLPDEYLEKNWNCSR